MKISNLLIQKFQLVLMAGYMAFTLASPVLAATGGEGVVDPTAQLKEMIMWVVTMGLDAIIILAVLIFGFGSVLDMLKAMAAQKFGMAHKMSESLYSLATGAILFLALLAIIPIVNMLIAKSEPLLSSLVLYIPNVNVVVKSGIMPLSTAVPASTAVPTGVGS